MENRYDVRLLSLFSIFRRIDLGVYQIQLRPVLRRMKYRNDIDLIRCDFVYGDIRETMDDLFVRSRHRPDTPGTGKLSQAVQRRADMFNDCCRNLLIVLWIVLPNIVVNVLKIGSRRPTENKFHAPAEVKKAVVSSSLA